MDLSDNERGSPMNVYRQEAALVQPDVSPERLAHLERCEAVLDAVQNAAHVDIYERYHKTWWFVEMEIDDHFYIREGEGHTLREATECAMDWSRTPEISKPQPSPSHTGSTGTISLILFVALAFAAGIFW